MVIKFDYDLFFGAAYNTAEPKFLMLDLSSRSISGFGHSLDDS